jgi:class 3 adenylate cyclase
MSQTRRLAAILAADVAGYSRLMEADEGGTLRGLKAIRAELIDPKIAAHNSRAISSVLSWLPPSATITSWSASCC